MATNNLLEKNAISIFFQTKKSTEKRLVDFNTLKIFLSDAEAASLWHIPLKNKCLLNATKWQLIYKIDVNELLRYFAVKIYRPIWRLRLIQIFLKCVPNAENNLYISFLRTCHLVTILLIMSSNHINRGLKAKTVLAFLAFFSNF